MKAALGAGLILVACLVSRSLADDKGGVQVDAKLPSYQKISGEVSGDIKSAGSDTMINLMLLWSAAFKKYYPDVRVEIEGKGSSTAPPALIEGTANFGPMSRDWEASESEAFEKKFGYKPTVLSTSVDMLAVYVNKDCPLESLTLEQVDAIFSSTRKGGGAANIQTWGEVGLKGQWTEQPISLYGRNASSGTYRYFKDKALFGGDFKPTVKEQPGSAAVINGIAADRYAIGYSGIGYKTADVKAIALDKGKGAVVPSPENLSRYPLARSLLISLNYKPGNQLDPLRREFLRYVFSSEGQREVIKDGYLPVSAAVAEKQLAKIGLGKTSDSGSK